MQGPGLFEEIRRRHVWRVAIAYAVVGWLLIQIATQVFPFFGIPDWAVRWVILLIAFGFPLAVVLAWVFEFTPEGIRRTEPIGSPDARPEHESRQIGRKLNATIMAVLVLAVALLGWRLLVLRRSNSTDSKTHSPRALPRERPWPFVMKAGRDFASFKEARHPFSNQDVI